MTGPPDLLEGVDTLDIRQDPETASRFLISDANRRDFLIAAEDSDETARTLLGRYRPSTFWLLTPGQQTYLELRLPFRLMYFVLQVKDHRGLPLGRVVRDFSLARPRYLAHDITGREIFRIQRHPSETQAFHVLHDGRQAGLIHRLSGQAIDDAPPGPGYFRVSFAAVANVVQKKILLGAVFLLNKDDFGGPGVTIAFARPRLR